MKERGKIYYYSIRLSFTTGAKRQIVEHKMIEVPIVGELTNGLVTNRLLIGYLKRTHIWKDNAIIKIDKIISKKLLGKSFYY